MIRSARAFPFWVLLPLAGACGGGSPVPGSPAPVPAAATAVLIGAGDIADCANDGGRPAEDTAKLLDKMNGTVFTAGDNVYPHGSSSDFAACYDPRWGRHRNRTRPAVGNHDYDSPGALPYYTYFGAAAGSIDRGFYAYEAGAWHVVVLNSNIPAVNGSEQWTWLRDNLSASRTPCALAYFHHPRFTSGPNGGGAMTDVWKLLYQFGVDVVINGDKHQYERFAPQDPDGRLDSAAGIREFVAGTGGAPLYPFVTVLPTSEMRISAYGVLTLTLRNNDYDWTFIEAVTEAIRDTGSALCH